MRLRALCFPAVVAVAFVLLHVQLGFYLDDWYNQYIFASAGTEGLIADGSIDRPLAARWHAAVFSVLRDSTTLWNAYGAVLQLACATAFWLVLTNVFGARTREAGLAALLVLLYPGLSQHGAIMYHLVFLSYALMLYSIAASTGAARSRRKASQVGLVVVAVVLQGLSLLLAEHCLGVDLLRYPLLAIVLSMTRAPVRCLRRVVAHGLPTLTSLAAFVGWRAFVFSDVARPETSVSGIVQRYLEQPHVFLSACGHLLVDVFQSTVLAWFVPVWRDAMTEGRLFLLSLGGGAVLGLVGYRWAKSAGPSRVAMEGHRRARPAAWGWMMLSGVVGVAAALLVVSFTLREIEFFGPAERYLLPTSAGAVLALVGAIGVFVRPRCRVAALGIAVGIAVTTQATSLARHIRDWRWQQEVFGEVTELASGAESGASFVIHAPHLLYQFHWAFWGPINVRRTQEHNFAPLWCTPLTENVSEQLRRGGTTTEGVRTVKFNVDWSKCVVICFPAERRSGRYVPVGKKAYVLASDRIPAALEAAALVRQAALFSHPELLKTPVP